MTAPSALVPDVRRIAVLRANGLGDFIFALPALGALRRAYPGAEIVLLGLPWHAEFLAGRPGPVDRVVVLPRLRGVGAPEDADEDPDEIERFLGRMRAERFDLAFQLHGGGRWSNPLVRRLGARLTVGLKTPDAAALDRWLPYVYFQPEVFRFLEVVALVGARAESWEPCLAVTASDRAEGAERIPPCERPLVVMHTGAGDSRRRWPARRFARVGDALADAGAQIVLNGTGDERPLVEEVTQSMGHRPLDLGADCTLPRLAGTLARSALVVSCDSGPLHLARAVGTATVGIYWCGNLINAGPTGRGRHRPLISWQLHCPACGTNAIERRCEHGDSFVQAVGCEEVTDAALSLLRPAG